MYHPVFSFVYLQLDVEVKWCTYYQSSARLLLLEINFIVAFSSAKVVQRTRLIIWLTRKKKRKKRLQFLLFVELSCTSVGKNANNLIFLA